jgi:hypothetical protein
MRRRRRARPARERGGAVRDEVQVNGRRRAGIEDPFGNRGEPIEAAMV